MITCQVDQTGNHIQNAQHAYRTLSRVPAQRIANALSMSCSFDIKPGQHAEFQIQYQPELHASDSFQHLCRITRQDDGTIAVDIQGQDSSPPPLPHPDRGM